MKIHKSILKDLVYKYPDEAERHIYNIRLMQQQEIDEELGTFVIEKLDGTVYRFDDEVDSEADTDKIERIEFE
jgi:hypothetical protein